MPNVMKGLERKDNKRFAKVLANLKRRSFAVGFRDGSTRIVQPSDDDPLQFEQQTYADGIGLKSISSSGGERLLFAFTPGENDTPA